jgi:hypothetical protein
MLAGYFPWSSAALPSFLIPYGEPGAVSHIGYRVSGIGYRVSAGLSIAAGEHISGLLFQHRATDQLQHYLAGTAVNTLNPRINNYPIACRCVKGADESIDDIVCCDGLCHLARYRVMMKHPILIKVKTLNNRSIPGSNKILRCDRDFSVAEDLHYLATFSICRASTVADGGPTAVRQAGRREQ